MELNVWTSCQATRATRNEVTNKWDVTVKRADGSERVMHVDYIVMSSGFPFKKTAFAGQVSNIAMLHVDFADHGLTHRKTSRDA